jgi:hypothetical protein
VRISGALVKVELADANDRLIQVELGRPQYEALHLAAGESTYVTPKRMRVFTSN